MSEQIKSQIRARLEGFEIKLIRADVDSQIFDNYSMAKISELSKEFDMSLIVEVIREKSLSKEMRMDDFHVKGIVANPIKVTGQEYESSKNLSPEDILELSKQMRIMFDELVVPSKESFQRLVKDPDDWISRVHQMKEKYGLHAFREMYNIVDRVRKLMWEEGFTEVDAFNYVNDLYTKELEASFMRRTIIGNQSKVSLTDEASLQRTLDNLNRPMMHNGVHCVDFNQLEIEIDNSSLFYQPTKDQRDIMREVLMHGMMMGTHLSFNTKGSGGHGYDISSNGSRHKKVVTGKAGNSYPVPKRRGVR